VGLRVRETLLEVLVGAVEDLYEKARPRPDAVLSRVPVPLRFVQGLVVNVLCLEDSLLNAHIPSDAVAGRQQLVGGEQPSEAAVAVGHGMDGKEVQDQRAD
jgi:hypothetical protein